ncbi:hypothetical protein QBC32DRAFT_189744, partial [Pseudoneurospora amorphoporcata]
KTSETSQRILHLRLFHATIKSHLRVSQLICLFLDFLITAAKTAIIGQVVWVAIEG